MLLEDEAKEWHEAVGPALERIAMNIATQEAMHQVLDALGLGGRSITRLELVLD